MTQQPCGHLRSFLSASGKTVDAFAAAASRNAINLSAADRMDFPEPSPPPLRIAMPAPSRAAAACSPCKAPELDEIRENRISTGRMMRISEVRSAQSARREPATNCDKKIRPIHFRPERRHGFDRHSDRYRDLQMRVRDGKRYSPMLAFTNRNKMFAR